MSFLAYHVEGLSGYSGLPAIAPSMDVQSDLSSGPNSRQSACRRQGSWTMRGSMHHLDLTVGDLAASAPFYETILDIMRYRRLRA